jgi:hypothetical protein
LLRLSSVSDKFLTTLRSYRGEEGNMADHMGSSGEAEGVVKQNEDQSPSIAAISDAVREDQVANAVAFLSHPKVLTVSSRLPVVTRRGTSHVGAVCVGVTLISVSYFFLVLAAYSSTHQLPVFFAAVDRFEALPQAPSAFFCRTRD